MRRRAVHGVGLVLAALGFSHPAAAQLRDGSDGTLPPRNPEPCSDLIPPLAFTKEDFEKGFDRTYTIPEFTECDGAAIGGDPEFYIHQSGQLRLHYVPSPIPRMYAEVRYRLREGCGADNPVGDFSWVWSGVLDPTDHDPEGIFPAAAYEDILAKPKILSDKACGGIGKLTRGRGPTPLTLARIAR
jgi:hypothetical protein